MASLPSGTGSLPQNRGTVQEGNRISFVVSGKRSRLFFFYSCRFGFYLKFGYFETESYFKRAKMR